MENITNINNIVNATLIKAYAPTSEATLTVEEEDAIVTLVVVVIGIIIAIIVLFLMGIFMDYRHQKKDSMKKRKRLRLKMPPLAQRNKKDDVKALASDMCPNGASDNEFKGRDAIV